MVNEAKNTSTQVHTAMDLEANFSLFCRTVSNEDKSL